MIQIVHHNTEFLRCIPPHQFAYKPMSNTTCALITLHNAITKSLDDDASFGAAIISFDFSNAFDTLPHHRLLQKLQKLHFPTVFFLWLYNYLPICRCKKPFCRCNRQQRMCIGDMKSDCLLVMSSVPQSSLLGPYFVSNYR